jgi:16S rRNA (adenine1518-N6/adenine1519-N6)-dimethyltransferase
MKRRYGQHFLKDPVILKRIVDASGAGPDDAVLEIGPGRGDLTRALASRVRKVYATEIDRRLFAALQEADLPANVELKLGDALALTGDELAEKLGPDYHLVSNLPYEITSKTLEKFLSGIDPKPRSITLLVQREVGERASGKYGTNRLALFCGYYAVDVRAVFRVPRGAFSPPPAVESSVIRLVPRTEPLLPKPAEAAFFRLAAAAFTQNRKQLRNSLKGILGLEVDARLTDAGISPDARPEDIPFDAWVRLALKM